MLSIKSFKNKSINDIACDNCFQMNVNNDSCDLFIKDTNITNTFPLKVGDELIYDAYKDDKTKYVLYLNILKTNQILFKFCIIHNDSIQLELADTVYRRIDNARSSHYGKYDYFCDGTLFENISSSKDYKMIIDENNIKYIGFQIWFPYYLYNLPMFIKRGVEEPYHNYLTNLINTIYSYENSKNKKLLKKELQKAYCEVHQLLNQIDTSGFKYNYKLDYELLDQATYLSLDSLINIFTSRGVIGRKNKSEELSQKFNRQDLKNTSIVIRHDVYNRVLSKRFECYFTKSKNQKEYKLPLGFRVHNANDNLFFLKDNYCIMLMPDDGFENINYVISIWKKNEECYSLEGIIDTSLTISIGGITIEKIVEINNKSSFIIGKSYGADGGEEWGNLWLGKLILPNSFKIVHKFEFSGYENHREYIKYLLDTENKSITITKGIVIKNDNNDKDSLIYNNSFNYMIFFN